MVFFAKLLAFYMVIEFIDTFFCKPILDYSGYNFVNTLVYGAIMIFLAFWVIQPFFSKKGVKFDYDFSIRVLLFVLAGSAFRILEDLRILPRSCSPLDPSFYTITPGVYILFGIVTIMALLVSLWMSKKTGKNHLHYFGIIGILLASPFALASIFFFKNILGFAFIALMWSAVTFITYLLVKGIGKNWFLDKQNILLVAGQSLDGTATFVATQLLNCGEQHPLSEAILGFFPQGFIVIKILIALTIIYFVEKEVKDPNMKGFVKIFVMILGFAPGIRDALTVAVGTCN